MRHGSLFSGIGGFDLAAQWMGWQNIFQVEKDPFCRAVLTKNFPNTNRYDDIKTFDGTKYRGTVDIVTGGFPCQPFSTSGKRKGADDDRYLWPEMLRVIREVGPRIIVAENVTGIISMVLGEVLTSLENEGYKIETFIIPACAVNASHRRDRVWIIAYSGSIRFERLCEGTELNRSAVAHKGCSTGRVSSQTIDTYTDSRQQAFCGETGRMGRYEHIQRNGDWKITSEPFVCRGTHGIPHRMDRLTALGNAIVPQVAFEIFKAIETIKL